MGFFKRNAGLPQKTVSFLVSGRGSNFKAVAGEIQRGKINAVTGILISDKPNAGALELAARIGVRALCIDPREYPSRDEHEERMIEVLEEAGTNLVVAAGYMRILTPRFVRHFRDRIINIHPALLPSFPGVNAQKQAVEYGVKVAGCTAHFIDEGTDTGPIIAQGAVAVSSDDTERTLAAKILNEEHRILPEAVRLFCEDRLRVEGRRVIVV